MVVKISKQDKFGRLSSTAFAIPTETLYERLSGFSIKSFNSNEQEILNKLGEITFFNPHISINEKQLSELFNFSPELFHYYVSELMNKNLIISINQTVGVRIMKRYSITENGKKYLGR
jgi:hypothetical protein